MQTYFSRHIYIKMHTHTRTHTHTHTIYIYIYVQLYTYICIDKLAQGKSFRTWDFALLWWFFIPWDGNSKGRFPFLNGKPVKPWNPRAQGESARARHVNKGLSFAGFGKQQAPIYICFLWIPARSGVSDAISPSDSRFPYWHNLHHCERDPILTTHVPGAIIPISCWNHQTMMAFTPAFVKRVYNNIYT